MISIKSVLRTDDTVKAISLRYKPFIENEISNYYKVIKNDLIIGVIGLNLNTDGSINVYIGQQPGVCRLSILSLIDASFKSIIDLKDVLKLSDEKSIVYFKHVLAHSKFKLQIVPNIRFEDDVGITDIENILKVK